VAYRYSDYAPEGFKPKRKNDHDEVTWLDAGKALGSLLLAMMLLSLINFFAQHIFLQDTYTAYANSLQMGAFSSVFTEPIFTLITTAIGLIISLVLLLLMYGVMHGVATLINGGNGTFRGLVYRANGWTFGVYFTISVISMVASFIWIDEIVAMTEMMAMGGQPSMAFGESMMLFAGVQYGSYLIGWLVWLFGMSGVLKENYHYETSSGCVTLAISHVVYVVLYFGLSFLLGLVLVGAMFSGM